MKTFITSLVKIPLIAALAILLNAGITAQYNLNTELIGQWAEGACVTAYLDEDIAFMNNGNYMVILDLSDPASPAELSRFLTPAFVNSITVHEDIAYVSSDDVGLSIVDVADPTAPVELGFIAINGFYTDVVYHDGYIFYSSNSSTSLHIIDVSDPAAPELVNGISLYSRSRLVIEGDYMYVAARWDGFQVYSIADIENPVLLATPTEMYTYNLDIDGDHLYLTAYDSMVVFDISTPAAPVRVATYYPEFGSFFTCSVNDGILLTPMGTRLYIRDVSDPANPSTISISYPDRGFITDIFSDESMALLMSNNNGISIVDISDLSNPIVTGHHDSGGTAYGIDAAGDHAFVADGFDGLRILDITDLTKPVMLADFPTSSNAYAVRVTGDYAYVANQNDGLLVMEVSDPASPKEVNRVLFEHNSVRNILINGTMAIVSNYNYGFALLDISDPANPVKLDSAITNDRVLAVAMQDNIIAVADWEEGVTLYELTPDNDIIEIGSIGDIGRIQSVAISGDYVYAGMSNPYVRVIDITNPGEPVVVGELYTSRVYELHIQDDLIYVSAGFNGAFVYDISDPLEPVKVGYYDTGGEVYDIAVVENTLFLADYNSGMTIIELDQSSAVAEAGDSKGDLHFVGIYPNPSMGPVNIEFRTDNAQHIRLRVYDSTGQLVDEIVNSQFYPGSFAATWKGEIPGNYFFELSGHHTHVILPVVIQ